MKDKSTPHRIEIEAPKVSPAGLTEEGAVFRAPAVASTIRRLLRLVGQKADEKFTV
jgi:hypothetical protein